MMRDSSKPLPSEIPEHQVLRSAGKAVGGSGCCSQAEGCSQ